MISMSLLPWPTVPRTAKARISVVNAPHLVTLVRRVPPSSTLYESRPLAGAGLSDYLSVSTMSNNAPQAAICSAPLLLQVGHRQTVQRMTRPVGLGGRSCGRGIGAVSGSLARLLLVAGLGAACHL